MVLAVAFMMCLVCFAVGLWLGLTASQSDEKPLKIADGKMNIRENEV